jgi:hypothetical protein
VKENLIKLKELLETGEATLQDGRFVSVYYSSAKILQRSSTQTFGNQRRFK